MNKLIQSGVVTHCVFLLFVIFSCNSKHNRQPYTIADSSLIVNKAKVFNSNNSEKYLEKVIEKLLTIDFFVFKRSRNVSRTKILRHNNFINSGIRFTNINNVSAKPIKELELNGLEQIELIIFKNNKSIGDNIYPKLFLEIWKFNSLVNRDKAKNELDNLTEQEWFYIEKSKILYWDFLGNNIMFLSAGGSYYDHKLQEIYKLIIETYE